MESLEFEGKTYIRYNGYWVNTHYEIAPLSVQAELNKRYAKTLSLEQYTVEELVRLGDVFKKTESYPLAVKHYQEAITRANPSECRYIYPRLTSCMRQIGQARQAVEILSFLKEKYGMKLITPVLLTSISAAYCDLKEYDNAKKCADAAYRLLKGNPSAELRSVYARIDKECGLTASNI